MPPSALHQHEVPGVVQRQGGAGEGGRRGAAPGASRPALLPKPEAGPPLPLDAISFGLVLFFNDTATTEIYPLSLHDVFRSPPDLRRPGGDRHRERAPPERAARAD